ncbi:MAG: Gamma-glutamyl phosphate reductase [Promethearchaeota archaeon]|nr:MAG: Gamma-glutamyl phosphate reductase [Candidatus Lokiarchaeota archaeon]
MKDINIILNLVHLLHSLYLFHTIGYKKFILFETENYLICGCLTFYRAIKNYVSIMSIENQMKEIGENAKNAAFELKNSSTTMKDNALNRMADDLEKHTDSIIKANLLDLENAEKNNLEQSKIDRLVLNKDKIHKIAEGLREVAAFPDPINEIISMWRRPNGMDIGKIRVPLGVVGIIYESRPNVTADAAGLCIKSGNAIILRGGSEAINSNIAIADILHNAAVSAGLPKNCIQVIRETNRAYVDAMLKLKEYIDVIIPRGGETLIQKVVQNSLVPTIETGIGIVSIFVNYDANFDMADKIIINSKCSYPAVCNALDKLLIHESIKDEYIPRIVKSLRENGVEVRGDQKTQELVPDIIPATEVDWGAEYLSLKISIRVVKNIDEAIEIITRYDSKHTESIITKNYQDAREFLYRVDAAAVYVNAATRLTDGGVFGLGAEIGISTQKLHARGPMGVNQLTSTKYIIYGSGQIRE